MILRVRLMIAIKVASPLDAAAAGRHQKACDFLSWFRNTKIAPTKTEMIMFNIPVTRMININPKNPQHIELYSHSLSLLRKYEFRL